ncbi:hypothetical protein ACWOQH_002904 [Vibrio parahaemolyticus]|uniref:hypothetical protein n=1 Tax=Vibrio parahaemolyticus TaxID=670 RepID=UPI0013759D6B|nr:hypothetical protein [Vibrio parahaemolyticus]EHK9076597.1 hypothetical protein [Vibrio parahaemolyticus]MBM5283485.1 hypothetical protein [Vibrio parahaemolyticus]MCF9092138.1 hypothetical protein [Vibrio parahaemolyticus]MCF9100141.1 hypothetical protein [Vibrio parahaemolyticus]NCN14641.1 hypothetical protein [Vibrio parahaemolyticus]
MKLTEQTTYDMTPYGVSIKVHSILINIDNIKDRASEMIAVIQDVCWLKELDPVAKLSYEARAQRTIEKLVDNVLTKVEDEVTEEFGEFMISASAQDALVSAFDHVKVPLAELLKEKISGNPGFDFHTETNGHLIAFGEAKFSGTINPYRNALEQIRDFINLKKNDAELVDLQNFVTKEAVNNHLKSKSAYVAAFSINSKNPSNIMGNAFDSEYMKQVFDQEEVYLIGVTVND